MFDGRATAHLTGFAAFAAVFALTAGSASAGAVAPQRAWGKPGVTYEKYRADALECGHQALATDIDHSAQVKTLRRASQELATLDQELGATTYSDEGMSAGLQTVIQARQEVLQTARTDQQYNGIKNLMFETARTCMLQSGYSRFNLTPDQHKTFSSLKDVEARRHYLYSLASDETVLQAQKYSAEGHD